MNFDLLIYLLFTSNIFATTSFECRHMIHSSFHSEFRVTYLKIIFGRCHMMTVLLTIITKAYIQLYLYRQRYYIVHIVGFLVNLFSRPSSRIRLFNRKPCHKKW